MLEERPVLCSDFNPALLTFSIMSTRVYCRILQQGFCPPTVPICRRLTALKANTSTRTNSNYAALSQKGGERAVLDRRLPLVKQPNGPMISGLERVPTPAILRNLFLGFLLSSPTLSHMGFKMLNSMAYSRSNFLSPDANPLLRAIVKPLFYEQFCAGTNKKEVSKTRDAIRRLGYAGVILCYGKEIQISRSNELQSTGSKYTTQALEVEQWQNGNLKTLDMVGEGDWIGLK